MPFTTEELEILHSLSKQTVQSKEEMKKHGSPTISQLNRRSPSSGRSSPTELFSPEERDAYRAKRAEEGLAHCRAQADAKPIISSYHRPALPTFSIPDYPSLPLPGPPSPPCRDITTMRWNDTIRALENSDLDVMQAFSSSKEWTYFVRRTPRGIMKETYHNGVLLSTGPA